MLAMLMFNCSVPQLAIVPLWILIYTVTRRIEGREKVGVFSGVKGRQIEKRREPVDLGPSYLAARFTASIPADPQWRRQAEAS